MILVTDHAISRFVERCPFAALLSVEEARDVLTEGCEIALRKVQDPAANPYLRRILNSGGSESYWRFSVQLFIRPMPNGFVVTTAMPIAWRLLSEIFATRASLEGARLRRDFTWTEKLEGKLVSAMRHLADCPEYLIHLGSEDPIASIAAERPAKSRLLKEETGYYLFDVSQVPRPRVSVAGESPATCLERGRS